MDDVTWTNFIGVRGSSEDIWWGNLHKFHLRSAGAYCHECHYNVHSNVESKNTIYGDGTGGKLPDDGKDGIVDGVVSTHLLNFAPGITGTQEGKPQWFQDTTSYPGYKVMRCYLSCHDVPMNTCFYGAPWDIRYQQCREGC